MVQRTSYIYISAAENTCGIPGRIIYPTNMQSIVSPIDPRSVPFIRPFHPKHPVWYWSRRTAIALGNKESDFDDVIDAIVSRIILTAPKTWQIMQSGS